MQSALQNIQPLADINITNFNERMPPIQNMVQSLKTPKPMQPLQIGQQESFNKFLEDFQSNPIGSGPMTKLPYIQSGTSRQEVGDLSSKVRELELTILDLKATLDRRVTQLQEEIPGRLQREVKNIEGRDSHMWRESLSKQATMMENIARLREQMKGK